MQSDLEVEIKIDAKVIFSLKTWKKTSNTNQRALMAFEEFVKTKESDVFKDENTSKEKVKRFTMQTKVMVATQDTKQSLLKIENQNYEEYFSQNPHFNMIYFVIEHADAKPCYYSMIGGISIKDFLNQYETACIMIQNKSINKTFISKIHLSLYKFYIKEDLHLNLHLSGDGMQRQLQYLIKNGSDPMFPVQIQDFIQGRLNLLMETHLLKRSQSVSALNPLQHKINLDRFLNNDLNNAETSFANCDLDENPCQDCKSFFYTFIFFCLFSGSTKVKNWWIESEMDLLRFRMKHLFQSQCKVLHIFDENNAGYLFGFEKTNGQILDVLNPFWADNHESFDTEPPYIWHNTDFIQFCEAISDGKIPMTNGKIYLSYDKIRDSIVHLMFKKSSTDLLENVKTDDIKQNVVDAFSVNEVREIDEKMEFLRKDVIDVLNIQNKPKSKRELPDIEDLGSGDLPLCQYHSISRLKTVGTIKHPQRMGVANFLRDVGYTDTQTEEFMFRHYDRNKRSVTALEETQWKTEVHRYSHGKPGTTFGKCCQTMAGRVEHAKTGDKKDTHGCPYVFYRENDIKDLLREKGLTNEDLIDSIAKIANAAPTKACQMELDAQVPKLPNEEYEHASPHGYVFKTLYRKKINFVQN